MSDDVGTAVTTGCTGTFRFVKSLLSRQLECSDVLQASKIPVPAGKIRNEWSYYVEIKIEPAGNELISID